MESKIIIAIDGLSSCGKSTMAKTLAAAVGYKYIDTGAMYRTVTLYALRKGFIKGEEVDDMALRAAMDDIKVDFEAVADVKASGAVLLNGEDVTDEIRSLAVARHVSAIAALDFVRTALVAQQRRMGRDKGVVMDGRDIGTVVFPDAELKFYIIASPEIRAQRRLEELHAKGVEASYEEILENVRSRDEQDMNRAVSPLRKADDAIEIDNSNLSIEQQNEMLSNIFNKVIHNG